MSIMKTILVLGKEPKGILMKHLKYSTLYKTSGDTTVLRVGEDLVINLDTIGQASCWSKLSYNTIRCTRLPNSTVISLTQGCE